MKAAVFIRPNSIDVGPVPAPQGGTVLKVRTCAVCGYDVRVFRNGHRKVTPPVVLGHEICAEVQDASVLPGQLKAGTRVAVYPQAPCLNCVHCKNQQYNMCQDLRELGSTLNGGFAEFVEVPESIVKIGGLVAVPDSISDEQAALMEPLACCLNSVSRMRLPAATPANVVIIGDGPIGLLHLLLCKRFDNKVCIVGRTKARMQKAAELGADLVMEYSDPGSTAVAIRQSFSKPGAEFVIIAASDPAAFELAQGVAGKNSVINLFAGLPSGSTLGVDSGLLHYGQASIIGSFGSTPAQMEEAVRLVADKQLDLGPLITRRYSLSEIQQALVDGEQYSGLRGVIDRF